ncbi:MAG: KUP/HAK/KT family potassium transporter [Salinivirgaceae bacterium]|nr:KUP/HAK/KT family potassium transporter [Salinivirgaceae bacterium]
MKGSSGQIKNLSLVGAIVALGIIFGDIGTSPLYVFRAILASIGDVTADTIIGALSCIVWTLTLQTTVKYVFITLKADNRGEGGIFSLFALLRKNHRKLFIIAIIGGCSLLADGVIAPSITVLSAVEGLSIMNPRLPVLAISVIIITFLFFIQQFGTNTVGRSFGPIMLIWFSTLGILGFVNLIDCPMVLKAFNPYYAIRLLANHPAGILLLGAVFLCTTGAEALYTDLGHCGIKNIKASWTFVKTMLIMNYMGQGAWIIVNADNIDGNVNPFYAIMPEWFLPIGIVLATMAAIVACQASITSSYTLISEAISLNFWPKIRIKYPSQVIGQMYVPTINWIVYGCCLFSIFHFRNSAALENVYGFTVTITMLMTSTLVVVYLRQKNKPLWAIALFAAVYLIVEGSFFVANAHKFSQGAWFTTMLAALLTLIMVVLHTGRRIRNRFITFAKIGDYLPVIKDISEDETLPKYATNLVYTTHANFKTDIEAKVIDSIIRRIPKRADVYWLLHVDILDTPYTLEYKVEHLVPNKVIRIDFFLGFKMQPRIYDYFKQVVNHLGEEGLDLRSSYPSLRKHNIPADFRIIHIERRVPKQADLSFGERLVLTLYYPLKRMGLTDVSAWGLDAGNVSTESIPLTIPSKTYIPEIVRAE